LIFNIKKKLSTNFFKHHLAHKSFIWLKPFWVVAAVIPLKRDAIDKLGLVLANLNRFVNVMALAKLNMFSLLSGQYFALEKSAFKRIGIYDWQEEFNDSI